MWIDFKESIPQSIKNPQNLEIQNERGYRVRPDPFSHLNILEKSGPVHETMCVYACVHVHACAYVPVCLPVLPK